MEDKSARFCLQFNTDDPVQKYAYEIIAAKGRKKSAFISEAVKFYMENGGGSSVPADKEQLRSLVRELVGEVLDSRGAAAAAAAAVAAAEVSDGGEDDGFADMLLEGLDAFE